MSAILHCQRCSKEFQARRSDALYCLACKTIKRQEWCRTSERNHRIPCPRCGTFTSRRSNLCLSCENKSRVKKYQGHLNPNWKEGRTMDDGYILCRVRPNGTGGRAYRPEHHLVWERANKRPLPKGWVIHHLNGVKDDNRLENLLAMPRNLHNHEYLVKPYQDRILELEKQVLSLQPT